MVMGRIGQASTQPTDRLETLLWRGSTWINGSWLVAGGRLEGEDLASP